MKTKVESLILLLTLAGLTGLTGCKKEPDPVIEPLLDTPLAIEVTVNSALLEGKVLSRGSAEHTARGFSWSKSQEPAESDNKLTMGKGVGTFTGRITGLLPGTDYYVRNWATSIEGTSYGDPLMITTPLRVTPASLITLDPEANSSTTFLTGGTVTDIGGGEITERGICWNTKPSPTLENFKLTGGAGSGSFTLLLTGLAEGITYYLRAYAINSSGVSYGTEVSYTTPMFLGIRKTDFPGEEGSLSVRFSIENKLYIGFGINDAGWPTGVLWEWDQVTNHWTRLADYPGDCYNDPVGFAIGGKGYIFANGWYDEGGNYINEFWEYDPALNKWSQKSSPPANATRTFPVAFSIGLKGYIGLGQKMTPNYNVEYYNDFWEWDPATDVWSKKADFPGLGRSGAAGFAIGNSGYVGTGDCSYLFPGMNDDAGPVLPPSEGPLLADFWEYNQASDQWTRKANYSGSARSHAVGFSISNKGYIGGGQYDFYSGVGHQDFWEWNPITEIWNKVGFVAEGINALAGGSVGGNGYYIATPVSYPEPVELWTFLLTSDK